MKTYLLFVSLILLLLPIQIHAQTHSQTQNNNVDYPWVPRISAYEAYIKYKTGKAILFHGGGAAYNNRHILGAINLDFKGRESTLQRFPKEGIEIFTYCY